MLIFSICFSNKASLNEGFSISRIHYGGGGDWYSDKTSIPNLLEFVSNNTNIITNPEEKIVKIGSKDFLLDHLKAKRNFFVRKRNIFFSLS